MARLACAGAVIALVAAIVWGGLSQVAWAGVAASVGLFLGLVVFHARVHAKKDRATAALRFHERGLARLDGGWTAFPSTGARYSREEHPYADDLDIFGDASLFQLIDATETTLGADRLADWLAGSDPCDHGAIVARQDAVKDLVPRVLFRERLSALGALLGSEKPDPGPFLKWAEEARPVTGGMLLALAAGVLPVVTIAAYALAPLVQMRRGVALVPLVLEIAILLQARGMVAAATAAASSRERGLGRYAEMLACIESESLDAPLLKALQEKLRSSGVEATREMARLARILDFLDARQNEVFRIFIGPVLMWDLNCALALDRWRARAGKAVRPWLAALGEVEALTSVAGFAFDRPGHAWPALAEDPRFVATRLGHPLLAEGKRVSNDVTLSGPSCALVVTGSNMSGKSTLLRAIGINAVLARAGAPVCATSLTIGAVKIATSMRVRDSLKEGVSRFYAELKKLKIVIGLARGGPCLFLLDEVLHGTNTRERLIGARAILRELLSKGALGAVSTHDLALGDLEAELPDQVKNVHFEEQVAGEVMTFDYLLRGGVVQSSNALRLMRIVGLDVAF